MREGEGRRDGKREEGEGRCGNSKVVPARRDVISEHALLVAVSSMDTAVVQQRAREPEIAHLKA